jgi:aminoglycoside 2''-phosphotransferase
MNVEAHIDIIKQSFPQIKVNTVVPATSGRDNYVLEINGDLIFRFPRRPDVEAQLLREIYFLPELETALSTPIPHFEYAWFGDENYSHPFVGYPKLLGLPIDDETITLQQRTDLISPLTIFINDLSSFPVELASQRGLRGGTTIWWRELYCKRYQQIQEFVFPLLEASTRVKAVQFWEDFLTNDTYFTFRPTLLHGDLWCHHILCDPISSTLTGVFDWGDILIGDPARDFIGFFARYGRDYTRDIIENSIAESDTTFWQRLEFYHRYFYHSFSEPLVALHTGNPELLSHSLEVLQTRLNEYE